MVRIACILVLLAGCSEPKSESVETGYGDVAPLDSAVALDDGSAVDVRNWGADGHKSNDSHSPSDVGLEDTLVTEGDVLLPQDGVSDTNIAVIDADH